MEHMMENRRHLLRWEHSAVKEDSKLQRAETVSVLVGTPYTERA